MYRPIITTLATVATVSLTSCGGGGSAGMASDELTDAGGGRGGTDNGFLSLNITDAPIDSAAEVWVQFDSIHLKSSDDDTETSIEFDDPKSIDLLSLQGLDSEPLLINTTVPAGDYEWLRLAVSAEEDGTLDSYIKMDDNSVHELRVPGGSQSGLKIIGGFEVIANTPSSLTIDFDLRKSVVATGSGKYLLKPVLRLVDDTEAGSIQGIVEMSALTDKDCTDADPDTGNAVYLYEGLNADPDDIGSAGEPVASAIPALNNASGEYEYTLGFIAPGRYTAAFTCQATLDDPDADDDIEFSRGTNINLNRANNRTIKSFR